MTETDTEIKPETPEKKEGPITPELEKLLERAAQSAADKVRTEYSQKLKDAQKQIEQLQDEKLSAKERTEKEQDRIRKDLEVKAAELNRKSLQLLAIKELETAELDPKFMDFVIGSDEDATKGRIKDLKDAFSQALGKAVDDKMKAQGRDPNKGRAGSAMTSGIDGMTPAEIKERTQKDKQWFTEHEAEIMKRLAAGEYKKK